MYVYESSMVRGVGFTFHSAYITRMATTITTMRRITGQFRFSSLSSSLVVHPSSSSNTTTSLCHSSIMIGRINNNSGFDGSSSRRWKSSLSNNNSTTSTITSIYQVAETNAALFDKEHGYTPTRYQLYVKEKQDPNRKPIRAFPKKKTQIPVSEVMKEGIALPPYARTGHVPSNGNMFGGYDIYIFDDDEQLENMKKVAGLARRVLDYACELALTKPNITTEEIDQLVHDRLISQGAYPSPLNYAGFPKSLCSSVNEVICHGIPDSRPLQPGDIVSFDVSCFMGGVHGDNCATVIIPNNNDDDQEQFVGAMRLVQATKESLEAAIGTCRPGSCLTEVGAAIHDVADAYGYDTVRKYRGHGIGSQFHCAPFVKHFRNTDYLELVEGMIFTIEPMLTEGTAQDCFEWPEDGWTVTTHDGGRAAQFEHTVLITSTGVEIITLPHN